MEKILECLTDPSWWFTAVVIAFLMSLFAGLLIKPLLRLIATRSNRLRAWLTERDRRLDERANKIMKDPTLIIVTYLYLITWHCMGAVLLILGFGLSFFKIDSWPVYRHICSLAAITSLGICIWIIGMRLYPLVNLTNRLSLKLKAKAADTPTPREAPTQPEAE